MRETRYKVTLTGNIPTYVFAHEFKIRDGSYIFTNSMGDVVKTIEFGKVVKVGIADYSWISKIAGGITYVCTTVTLNRMGKPMAMQFCPSSNKVVRYIWKGAVDITIGGLSAISAKHAADAVQGQIQPIHDGIVLGRTWYKEFKERSKCNEDQEMKTVFDENEMETANAETTNN